jgi:hypothetical protein
LGTNSKFTSTVRPQEDDVCPWRFTLYYEDEPLESDPLAIRYFFYQNGGGNCFHSGHLPKKQDDIMKRASQIDENELKIVNDGMEKNLSSVSMSVLLRGRTGLVIDPKKIRNHHMRSQQSKVGAPLTAAEEIIQKLTSNKSVSVVYLVAKVEVGSQLITSYTKGGKKKVKKDLKISFESNIVNGSCVGGTESSTQSSTREIDPTTFLTNGPDTPEKTAEDIYNSLKIESSAEILLCIAWCNDKQRRLLALFPEALTTDVIFKTNWKQCC